MSSRSGGGGAGIEALTKLYRFPCPVAISTSQLPPETLVDSNLQRITLVMHLNEQRQYRVGTVNIHGLDPVLEARLRSILVPGEVINIQSIDAFFKENRSILPPRGVENLELRRNPQTGIVDATFSPPLCP